MATDFRALTWAGQPICTATATPATGFTAGHTYQVKAAAIDNTTGAIWVAVVNDAMNLAAVQLPNSAPYPFTFQ